MPQTAPYQPTGGQSRRDAKWEGEAGPLYDGPFERGVQHASAAADGRKPSRQQQPHASPPPNDASHRGNPGDEKHKRYERVYWIVTGAASVAATAATITAAWFAVGAYKASLDSVAEARKQAVAAREANEINRRTLAAAVGASAYFGNVFHMADTVQADGTTKTTIRFKIGNSGGSTTRSLTYQSACADSVESRTDPYDRNVLDTKPVYRVALPPKSEIEPIACTLEVPKVVQLAIQNRWIYVFGLASYRDTTDPDTWHHVEFCLMTHGFGAGAGGVTTIQTQCERHNCADDECSAP